jgi:hypothetical protein
MSAYHKELEKILRDASPAGPITMTRRDIELEIADLTDQLQRPMSNVDRLNTVEARVRYRKMLATMV